MMGAWNMAEDLESLRIHLGLEKLLAVLGHSNGGAMALAYAEKYPLRLDRLILVDHQLIGNKTCDADPDLMEELKDDPRYKEAYDFMRKERDLSSGEAMLQRLKNIGPLYFYDPKRYVHWFHEAPGNESISVWCYEHQDKCETRLRDPPILIDRMPEVEAKTLVIVGMHALSTVNVHEYHCMIRMRC